MVRVGAWWCASLLAVAMASPSVAFAQVPDAPSAQAVEEARQLFREGVAAAEAGRWDLARERFRDVLVRRSAPLVHFNLALACRNSGHLVEAIEQFRQFARDPAAAGDLPRLNAATREINELGGRLARLQVVVSGDAPQGFVLDTRTQDLSLLGTEIVVDPGNHVVVVEGRAGDRQLREGNLAEGSRTQVAIALTPTAPDPVTTPVRTTAPPRAQSFGHWVTRPGPDGRWVEWAARGTPTPLSVWERRPFTLAVGLGIGSPAGIFSLSMRYFPQRWFGLELAGGGPSGYGPGFLLHVHARVPLAAPSIYAFGLFVGPAVNLSAVQLTCVGDCDSREAHVATLSLDLGTAHEWRLGDHFTLRATLGLRWIVNAADLRALKQGQAVTCASTTTSVFGDTPCGSVYGDASGLGAFLGLDIGYGIGP